VQVGIQDLVFAADKKLRRKRFATAADFKVGWHCRLLAVVNRARDQYPEFLQLQLCLTEGTLDAVSRAGSVADHHDLAAGKTMDRADTFAIHD
jgi:hypothetical protein